MNNNSKNIQFINKKLLKNKLLLIIHLFMNKKITYNKN